VDIQKLLGSVLSNAPAEWQNTAKQVTQSVSGQTQGQSQGQSAGQSGGSSGGLPGGLLGGAAAGGLMAALLGSKKVRKFGGKALTYGGLAVLGGLAYKAWSDHKAGRPNERQLPAEVPEPPADSAFDPAANTDSAGEDFRLAILRAMIAAANADGHVDETEMATIRERISEAGLSGEEAGFLFGQLAKPSDPIAIANLASGEEQGAELYLASLLAVDVDTPEENRYLQRLGDALRLPDDLRDRLVGFAEDAKRSDSGTTGA